MNSDDERERIALQLIGAYFQLAVTSPKADGSRVVVLGQFGRAEVHLTELPLKSTGLSIPPFWIEVFSRDDSASIDGYGCFDFSGDELTAAVDLLLDVKQQYRHHS